MGPSSSTAFWVIFTTASPALILDMDDSALIAILLSTIQTALSVRSQAERNMASNSTTSASRFVMRLSGRPYRISIPPSASLAFRNSSAARAIPSAEAPTRGRVASKVRSTPLYPSDVFFPCSTVPSIFSSGTRQSCNTIAAVSLQRMPSFFSSLVTVHPGVPASTTKERIPLRPASGSIVAHTITNPGVSTRALWPPVTKIFSPLSTQSAPSRTAVVLIAAVSDPAWGSVMAMAEKTARSPLNRSRNLETCSGVPAADTAAAPSPPCGVHR